MIELGMHTDNWRPLSGSFQTACESAVKHELEHIEFAVIHGQNFLQALGYDPGISLQSNPRALKRYCDERGLKVSQIDGSYPMMGPDGSAFGVQYVQQSIRFAAEVGCPMVDTVDGAFEIEGFGLEAAVFNDQYLPHNKINPVLNRQSFQSNSCTRIIL